jgi:hypothetical protein
VTKLLTAAAATVADQCAQIEEPTWLWLVVSMFSFVILGRWADELAQIYAEGITAYISSFWYRHSN